ncbi:MAG: peptide-binding protein [Candidatus Omnitrophica bacterium]|nr:peptide-binding protein [Candidatus Omnitrophota bacterium]MBD3268801.1 peptide-binding protein [Candidatus Omnitrophota bacterium]
MRLRKIIFILIVLYSRAIFAGNLSPGKDKKTYKPAYGGAIIDSSIGEPTTLIPMLASDAPSHAVSGLILNGLVKYDKDLTLTGDLAKSWDISEDGLVITFHLRKGVKWQDGVEFTAEDVLFGFETITDPNVPTAYKEDYLQVKETEVVDKYTFRVKYEKPFAPGLSSWGSLVVLPKHILEGKDITKTDFGRNPIGLGPFKFVSWETGQRIVLEANPDYYEGRPYLDKYIYRIIPDSATSFMELKAGGIDFMGLTPIQYRRQTDTRYFKDNFQKFRYPAFSYTYLGFNLKHPWFKDKKVRQAIAYAIDKKEIIKGVLFGLGSPATGPYVPHTWPYNPDVKKYPYKPDKAKALLRDCGWQDEDGDGILEKDGNDFEFTILTNMGNSLRTKTASIIQWRLSQIGIRVDIRVVEWSTFINEFIDEKRFEVVLLGWNIGLDPDQYDIWHSSKTDEKELNFISYSNPEVDELLERGRRIFDIEKRKKIYYRMQEILAEEQPYIFLYVPDNLPIIHKRFKGIEPAPIGIGYNIEEWFVPEAEQKHRFKE